MEPDDDPGWELSPRTLLFLWPGYLRLRARRAQRAGDGLAVIRQVWISFAAALLLIGAVSAAVAPTLPKTSATPWVALLAVVAIGATAAESWALARPLRCESLVALSATFRTRFFLAIAFSESVALFGFVATINTGRWWLYFLGLPVGLIGHLRAAPTRGNLEAAQDDLRAKGCGLSLVRALRTPAT